MWQVAKEKNRAYLERLRLVNYILTSIDSSRLIPSNFLRWPDVFSTRLKHFHRSGNIFPNLHSVYMRNLQTTIVTDAASKPRRRQKQPSQWSRCGSNASNCVRASGCVYGNGAPRFYPVIDRQSKIYVILSRSLPLLCVLQLSVSGGQNTRSMIFHSGDLFEWLRKTFP